jgi:hypothetical protein
MMKRRGANNKRVSRIQRPSLEPPDSGNAVVEKTQEQLFGELATNVCKLTGTHSYPVGDRIIRLEARHLPDRRPTARRRVGAGRWRKAATDGGPGRHIPALR